MELKVTVSELRSAASKLEQQLGEFEAAAKEAKAAADDLAGKWEGDAQKAFVSEQQKNDVWFNQMTKVGMTYVQALRSAAAAYEAADAAAKGAIG